MSDSFVLVDCNNFYVSCERLFNPSLHQKAVIVLSSNDGCVVARSQEAKQLGIKMGEPYFKIKDRCGQHGVLAFSSNYALYGDLSQRVMELLVQAAPEIQIYSIDEAFLKYPAFVSNEELLNHCIATKKKIRQWVGIPVSFGIAPTKTLAKVANDLAKKNRDYGIFDLSLPQKQDEALKDLPVEEVWGIGRALSARLHVLGIYTAEEFRQMDPPFVRKKFGVVGERMLWELRGISCLPLTVTCSKKSITCSRSFGQIVTKQEELAEALATFSHKACIKLRQQESYAKALTIFLEADLKNGLRYPVSSIASFSLPTNDTSVVIGTAKKLLKKVFNENLSYKKCGVILLDLVSKANSMPDLFASHDNKREQVMATLDAVNDYFGKETLFFGAMGTNPKWKTRSENRSRGYTSCWDELAKAQA